MFNQPSLGQSPENRLRRTRARHVRNHVGSNLLDIVDPARTAGREVSEGLGVECSGLFGTLEVSEHLGAFFHDGHVGRPIGIHHVVCAHALERTDDLALHIHAGGQAELFGKRHSQSRSKLKDRGD